MQQMSSWSPQTSLPVGDYVLKTNKYLPVHIQLIDGGVDGILAGPVHVESVSISDNQENSAANVKHFPVRGTERLDWVSKKKKKIFSGF